MQDRQRTVIDLPDLLPMMSSAAFPSSSVVAGDIDERRRPRGNASYVSGMTDDPLRFVTVSQALDEAVAAHGSRAAAIFSAGREVLTWKDLQRQSDEVAAALLALGLRRGSRVGIWSANRREWLITQLGAARVGAVLVSINPLCQRGELESALNKLRCGVLILERTLQGSDRLGLLRGLAPEMDRPGEQPVLDSRRLPHLKHVIVMGEGLVPARAQRFSDFVRRASVAARRRLPALAASLDPDDAIAVQFTGGATGVPKAVALSHFSVVNNGPGAGRAGLRGERCHDGVSGRGFRAAANPRRRLPPSLHGAARIARHVPSPGGPPGS
jgi:fatty-acyl-CoA synthase